MAVMGRKKQMVKQMIDNRRSAETDLIKQQREKDKEKEKSISEEEHKKRLETLKNLGLLK
jgi:hypothetical protein